MGFRVQGKRLVSKPGQRIATNTAVCLGLLLVVLVLAAAIAAGAMDRFVAADPELARRSAIGALFGYWFLVFVSVWLIPFACRHPRHVALSVAAAIAALGMLEVGARLAVPGAGVVHLAAGGFRSREFHHIYPASTRRYMGTFEGAPVFLETNEDGLRTSYSREEFRTYDQRVIFLGDSFTFGLGVTSDDVVASRVEAQLRDRAESGAVAVLNAGIVSYSPFLERLLFEKKLVLYRPTLVVLFLDATDIGDDYAYMRAAARSGDTWLFPFEDATAVPYRGALTELSRPYRRRFMSALRYPFELAGYGRGPYADDYYDFELVIGGARENNRYFIYRHPLAVTRQFFETTLGNVDAIADSAARIGARFALVVTPRFHHWNIEECPNNWEAEEYGLAEPYQFEYFRYFDQVRRHYPIINLLSDFQTTDEYPLVFADDPHWNAAGHAFVARTVTKHLLGEALIRPTRSSGQAAPRRP